MLRKNCVKIIFVVRNLLLKLIKRYFGLIFHSSQVMLFLFFSVLSALLLQTVICIQQEEIQKILRVHNSFRRNYAKRGLQNEIANMKLLVSN